MEIYWEPQKAAFCGVHAVNNLLQGPWYTEWDFSKIALALTEDERKIMAEKGTESKDYLVFMAKDSTHVDESGNFSIEVIKRAITNVGLTITSLNHPKMNKAKENPQNEIAYICNFENHWQAIRKIGGVWYNLNSISKNGPHTISDLYLGAFLQQLQFEKYSIFVIKGSLPNPVQEKGNGMHIKASDISNKGTKGIKAPQDKKSTVDKELEKAIAMSLENSGSSARKTEDEQLRQALALSTNQASRKNEKESEQDEDLRRAIEMSMSQ
ncbi:hypothetical protein AAMO2058_000278300 [Amorphochlora amoebiformis]